MPLPLDVEEPVGTELDSSSEMSEYAGLAGPPDDRCLCKCTGFCDLFVNDSFEDPKFIGEG